MKRAEKRGNPLRQGRSLLAVLPLYLFTIVMVLGPLVYMIALSFMRRASGGWGVEAAFTLENYARILRPVYLGTVWRSLQLALLSTGCVILIGYPFGYFMARLSSRWQKRIMFLVIVPFWTSSLLRLYGWVIILRRNGILEKALLWLGISDKPLMLLYSYPAVLIGMVYVLLPFMIYSVYSSAEKMDWSLVEAARDLGASPMRAFFTVTLRLTMPGLLSGIILTFIPSMGLYFIADLLGGNKIVLVGSIIQEQLSRASDRPFAAAFAVVLMLLTSLFLYLYKKITKTSELEGLI